MEISYHGANAVEIATKQATLVVDGALSAVGLKDVKAKDGIYIGTQEGFATKTDEGMTLDGPGEYEVKDISIRGIAAERRIDHDKSRKATIYRVSTPQVSVVVLGHVASPLTEEQLEEIGMVDIVIIPIGGNGYTFDAHQAVETVRQIDPKVVIPTHYEDSATSYEVPQMGLEPFVKELGAAAQETTAKYKIKNGVLPEVFTLIELTRS